MNIFSLPPLFILACSSMDVDASRQYFSIVADGASPLMIFNEILMGTNQSAQRFLFVCATGFYLVYFGLLLIGFTDILCFVFYILNDLSFSSARWMIFFRISLSRPKIQEEIATQITLIRVILTKGTMLPLKISFLK